MARGGTGSLGIGRPTTEVALNAHLDAGAMLSISRHAFHLPFTTPDGSAPAFEIIIAYVKKWGLRVRDCLRILLLLDGRLEVMCSDGYMEARGPRESICRSLGWSCAGWMGQPGETKLGSGGAGLGCLSLIQGL